jgi:DNA-binding NtrC family response regulator
VLISGETGTGKDLVAHALHAQGPRHGHAFVPFNCALGDSTLLESELFGHAKGAYTGAVSARQGLVRLADGGTLFLDEIGELPLTVQAKLLRLLEQRELRPIGSDRTERVDVRLVAATHRDLRQGVQEGWFRADLYHRLAVTVLEVPPLRARLSDLEELADHLLEQLRRETRRDYRPVPQNILTLWRSYDWPGNVRELRNVLQRAVVEASGLDLPMSALVPDGLVGGRPGTASARPLDPAAIDAAIAQCGGNRTRAADRLGISRATLYRRWQRTRSDS